MSIQSRLIAVMVTMLLGTMLVAGCFGYIETRGAVSIRLMENELPATVRAVRNQIDKELLVYLTASQDIADNTFVRDWIAAGEPAADVAKVATYLTAVQKRFGTFNASVVSNATRSYYDQSGLNAEASKAIQFWFDAFLQSNAPYEMVLDRNETTGNKFKLFTNVRMEVDGKLAAGSMGVDAETLAARIAAIKIGKSGFVYVISDKGEVKLHRDTDLLGKMLNEQPGIGDVTPALLDTTEVDGEARVNIARYTGASGETIAASSYIPSIKSFVVVEIPEVEVFGSIQDSFLKIGLIVLGILCLAIVAVFFIARGIARPIATTTQIIDRIAGGDGSVVVPTVKRQDEIGRMLRSTQALKDSVVDAFRLRKMVEDLPTNVILASPRSANAIRYANRASLATFKRLGGKAPVSESELVGFSADRLFPAKENAAARLADPAQLPFSTITNWGDEVVRLEASAIHDGAGKHIDTIVVLDVITRQERLASSFEANVKSVTEAASQATAEVAAHAGTMVDAAGESVAQSTAAANASEMASSNVQAVATATEELSSSIREISRQVQQSAGITGRAVSEAKATDETVQTLAQAAEKIGDIVRLIDDIASQTNLLALNATIEAARAGEAGKGFAVVASEVKNLAMQTSKATEEITNQIGSIQSQTGQAVEAIRRIGETIAEVNSIVSAIAAAVEEQGAATAEIARNVQQASQGTQSVSSNISAAARSANSTGAAASAVRGNADQLTAMMDKLQTQVDQFLLGIRQN
ncbi:MAG: HAMP domain-containing protein [Proteobacteria bacterium]|nr:HAMP domain-containing protein [Pseudomonadota bacterium]